MLLICQQRFLFNVFLRFLFFHKNTFLTFFYFWGQRFLHPCLKQQMVYMYTRTWRQLHSCYYRCYGTYFPFHCYSTHFSSTTFLTLSEQKQPILLKFYHL